MKVMKFVLCACALSASSIAFADSVSNVLYNKQIARYQCTVQLQPVNGAGLERSLLLTVYASSLNNDQAYAEALNKLKADTEDNSTYTAATGDVRSVITDIRCEKN